MYSPVAMRYPIQMAKPKKSNNAKNANMVTSSAPAAMGTKTKRPAPKVSFTPDGNCRISHTEYVTDVFSSTAQVALPYTLNPQNSATFTWLAAIATRYEMYKFESISLVYKPSCATTTQGYIMMGIDFDAYDTAPSKSAMMNWKYATKSAAWQDNKLNCSSALGVLPYRYCETDIVGDTRVTDLGKIWLLTDNADAVRNIGELFVTYTVCFKQPSLKIPNALFATLARAGSAPWVQETGNLRIVNTANNDFKISTPGKYLIVADTNYTTTNTTLTATALAPVENPSSEFQFAADGAVNNTNTRVNQWELDLISGSVFLSFVIVGTGTFTGVLKFSTYRKFY